MDILPHIGRLSKTFQAQSLDFSEVMPEVNATIDSLKDLVECSGVFVEKLSEFVVEKEGQILYMRPLGECTSKTVKENLNANIEFEGFESEDDEEEETVSFEPVLRYHSQQHNVIEKVASEYVDKICENLIERFQDSVLIKKFHVLVPSILAKQNKVGQYGRSEITEIITHYMDVFGLDKEACLSEYQYYKRLVLGSYKDESLVNVVIAVENKHKEKLPNILFLLKCAVVIPVTSVQCERGFSTQNRIKNNFRTRLNNKSLDELMRISEDGPSMRKFDFSRALQKWKSMKTRKIYQK